MIGRTQADARPYARPYRGRFAPSPTGPLHFGSLVAALGSFLDARTQGGRWFVRIEDLDERRTVPGAADAILRTLDAFGLTWDGPILYQRQRREAYEAALASLRDTRRAFPCGCSRKDVARLGPMGPEGPIYPGTCRGGLPPGRRPRTVRFRMPEGALSFRDRFQGDRVQDLARDVGDFILWRGDGIPAYQLAVVVDDAFQGITQVVRGADLLDSTPRQIQLQRALDLPTPTYAHLPLVLDGHGKKLSKSDRAYPLDARDPVPSLLRAWRFLGQPALEGPPETLAAFWAQALARWNPRRIPKDSGAALAPKPRTCPQRKDFLSGGA